MVQVKNAVNYSFRQKFKPRIKNGVGWNIDWERTATAREQVCYQMAFQERDVRAEVNGDRGPGISERKLGESSVMFLIDSEGGMIDSGEETIQSGFNFRGVGNFTFNGRTGHLGVVISWLVGERARESSLQTSISGGGADGFSNTMSGRNMFRTRRMCNGHRGTRSRPSLLYSPGVESKGRNEILRGKRDSVGAIAIVRRVDNKGDVIREHFVDIKDNTSVSVTTERVPSNDRKRIRSGGWEDFNSGRGGAG